MISRRNGIATANASSSEPTSWNSSPHSPLVREALAADADLGTGSGGGVHATAPGAAVPADRQVAGLRRGGQLAAHAVVEDLHPRRPHPPVELQDVHLHLGDLVDQAAVVLHAHVPGVCVPHVHAAELARRRRRHVQLRQLQGRLPLGDDVAGELEHRAQPFQELVRRMHGPGVVPSCDHHAAAPVEIDRLQQIRPVSGEPTGVHRAPLHQPAHGVIRPRPADQDQTAPRPCRGFRDDRQPSAAQQLDVAPDLLRHEPVNVVGRGVQVNRAARDAVLDQDRVAHRILLEQAVTGFRRRVIAAHRSQIM